MKKILCLALLFLSVTTFSQVSNLAELATGKLQKFSPIIETDGSIFGYFIISILDRSDKEHYRYEYVLLDKNLNKVANGEFEEKAYRGLFTRFFTPEKIGDKLLITSGHINAISYFSLYNTHRILDIKTNKLSASFYLDKGQFIEGERPNKKLMKNLKKIQWVEHPMASKGGMVLNDIPKLPKHNKLPQTIKSYGLDKQQKWSYNFNEQGDFTEAYFQVVDDHNIVFTLENKTKKTNTIQSIDPTTGTLNFSYELENSSSKANHIYTVEALENSYVIVGKMSPYNKKGYDTKKALGVFKIELDKKGNELSKTYFFWNQTSEHLPLNKKGLTKDGFRLVAKSYFVFKDGSVSILTEKRKPNWSLFGTTSYKTADFVILNFDKDFKLKNISKIEKDLSKWSFSDYLYSQKIKDGNGVVFFYNDHKQDAETKKKNWVLGIVTIINGEMTHEQIPMSSEEHFILPYIAKEGYILLRELNKDSDYDQIRLERLNY